MIENYIVQDGYFNDEEPEVAMHCDGCGGEIYVGDEFYSTDGGNFCENCADEYFWKLKRECCKEAYNG